MSQNVLLRKEMLEFLAACCKLGAELLDKENLSEKEEQFLSKLDLIADKFLKALL